MNTTGQKMVSTLRHATHVNAEKKSSKSKQCGKEFDPKSARQIFCSRPCSQRHGFLKRAFDHTCKKCGKKFKTKSQNTQFCSDKCRYNITLDFNKTKGVVAPTYRGEEPLTAMQEHFLIMCEPIYNPHKYKIKPCLKCGRPMQTNGRFRMHPECRS